MKVSICTRYKGRRRLKLATPTGCSIFRKSYVAVIIMCTEFAKTMRLVCSFNIQLDRVSSKTRRKRRRRRKKRRGKKSLGLLCIGISLVFPCISFLKAIFPGGCYLHTRQPDVGHYKKDRCRLKYKVTVGEFYIFFLFFKIRGIIIQVHPFSITRRLGSVTNPA